MSRHYNYGDVAMVKNKHGVWNRCIYTLWSDGCDGWRPGVADTFMYAEDIADEDVRLVAVVDHANSAQVCGLMDALNAGGWMEPPSASPLHQIIREYIEPTPPKPEEPTGLGAVVINAKGETFVRTAPGRDFPWTKSGDNYQANAYAWDREGGLDGSPPVEVLHEGYKSGPL